MSKMIEPSRAQLIREPDLTEYNQSKVSHIFVYGTLKSKHSRNHSISSDCTLVTVDSLKGYMFHLGSFPAYVPEPSGMDIYGEVWEVPEQSRQAVMARLDGIEGLPHLYYRLPFRTKLGYVAWAYWMPSDRIDAMTQQWAVVTSGVWTGEDTTPWIRWKTFITQHEEYMFPTKPKVFKDKTLDTFIVDQFATHPESRDYTEVSPVSSHTAISVSFSGPRREPTGGSALASLPWPDYKTKLTAAPKKPVLPDAPNVIDLAWLDDVHAKEHKTCDETHVDGI